MSRRSSSKKDPHHPHIWMLAVVVFVMALSFFQFPAVQTSAAGLNFSFFRGVSFFRIDFSQLFNSELFLSHSSSLMQKSNKDCSEIGEACKREYRRCLGTLKDADQYADAALRRARNGCIYSCAGEPEPCFGLDLETELNPPPPPPPVFTCDGPQERSCLASNGQNGTQMATSCDSSTSEWIFGECVASAPEVPPPLLPPPAPTYGPCGPSPDPDYRVCERHMGLGMRYGKEIFTCNTNTKQWVYRVCNGYPASQPSCVSYTYEDWSECQSDGQGGYYQFRKVLDSEPYGCWYENEDLDNRRSCEP